MLSSLTLSNVALIKKQSIDFKSGFNCLLGQSGAGKSLIIDALSFLLGAKVDKTLIRSGESNMRVDGVFVDLSEDVKSCLNQLEIDFDDELIISRSLSLDGKSSIKICGFPATLKMLNALAECLADFCGQHDSVGLLNVNNHLSFLDKFAGVEAENQKENVKKLFSELNEIKDKIASLGGNESERKRNQDLYQYQIDEIEKASLQLGEVEELKERYDFISSSEKIYERVGEALQKLEEGRENATSLLYDAKNQLSTFSNFKDIEEARLRIENCYYELKDVSDTLNIIKQNTDFDPLELERIDARLDLIKNLCKKYGKTVEDVLDFQQECQKKLEELQNSEEMLKKFDKQKNVLETQLENACAVLSETRKKSAKVFEKKICAELEDLQMKGAKFVVDFQKSDCTRNGFDVVKFMFSANVGQEVRDLHRTASGGELSRLLLAFKNIMLGKEKVSTVVFDEIDAGISGHTAGMLADKLLNISKFTQIICITHTAVVASKADKFLFVEKKNVDNNTISVVSELDELQSITEIARLIDGGKEVSQTALEHAKKLYEA